MRADGLSTDRSIRRHALTGLAIVFGLLGGLLTWSALAKISGAVIAPGHIAVDTSARKVQHPEGGVVAELRVRQGARVAAGDVLSSSTTRCCAPNWRSSPRRWRIHRAGGTLAAERDAAGTVASPGI